jgi:hypothetical protein
MNPRLALSNIYTFKNSDEIESDEEPSESEQVDPLAFVKGNPLLHYMY